MSEELKPVNCGCGGKVVFRTYGEPETPYCIQCTTCGTTTLGYATESEAIEAWNKAMTPHCCMTCQNWHWSKECSTNARGFCDDYEGWS